MSPVRSDNHNLLLKGYLPVRVRFPSIQNSSCSSTPDGDDNDSKNDRETFFYVREHQYKKHHSNSTDNSNNNSNSKSNTNKNDTDDNTSSASSSSPPPTLFVANAPSFPPIDTPTMLQTLLGKFGNIKRITVVPNPRHQQQSSSSSSAITDSDGDNNIRDLWYFEPTVTDKFAHVVFESTKDLKRCYKALERVMSTTTTTTADAALMVDAIERQTLVDALMQRRQIQQKRQDDDASASSVDEKEELEELVGIHKVLHTYRQHQTNHQQRDALLEECNVIMQAYEDAEQARLRAISSEPDEDGFVTVTHATQPAVGEQLEQSSSVGKSSATASTTTSKGRSRKRKKGPGATELSDFYRFQTKAKRRHDVQDLRQRFQDDLERIRKIKEDNTQKGFRPFK